MVISAFTLTSQQAMHLKRTCQDYAPTSTVKTTEEPLTLENVKAYEDSEIIIIFIRTTITRELLSKLPKLRYIITRSSGYDHIDLEATTERAILVSNLPAYSITAVAEFTFTLMLALIRHIKRVVRNQVMSTQNDADIDSKSTNQETLCGTELYKKTLGILGTGNIGKRVARIAKGFDMNVIAFDLYPDHEFAHSVGFKYTDTCKELCRQADLLSIHIPYTEENHHFFNRERLTWVKKESFLINTARGLLIDNEALLNALNQNHLAGAALDVLPYENIPYAYGPNGPTHHTQPHKSSQKNNVNIQKILELNKRLINHEHVLATPHIAYDTKEALEEQLKQTLKTLKAYLAGKPIHCV